MTVLDPDLLRSKQFSTAFRGYRPSAVAAYFGRIALALQVLAMFKDRVSELPEGLRPADVRAHRFDIRWRGLDRVEVDTFMAELAEALEQKLGEAGES